ncbi:TNF receptor-associated factor 5 [Aphidius gifuensis]|uniref:TNF receptor-associated factor 5 n=1 Tax=Aphidius gifuensis TaxID=684658 RepID=UPI001CDB95AF|nr:TNF receptor-associated factor 5 [Aphidius gifuensis]
MTNKSEINISEYLKTVECYFCSDTFNENEFIEHIRLCGSVLESCPQKCGAYVPRKSLKIHKRFCLKRVRFDENNLTSTKLINDNNTIENKDLNNWHDYVTSMLDMLKNSIKNYEYEHNELIKNSCKTLKKIDEIDGITKNIKLTIFGDSEAIRQRFLYYDKQLKYIDDNIVDVDTKTRDSFDNVAYRMDVIHGSIINEKNKQNIVLNKFENDIKELKNFFNNDNNIFDEYKIQLNDIKLELEMRCKKQNIIDDKYDIISEKIDIIVDELKKNSEIIIKQEKKTKIIKGQMKEMIKCLEEFIMKNNATLNNNNLIKCNCGEFIMNNISSINGRLIWRIDRYKEKMTISKETNEALLSPIFYNKEYGYALQMELYLNGRDRWKDRNIIGCLKVIDGPWDPLLDWPCILRATVTLRDQDNPANNIKKIIKTKAKINNINNNSIDYDSTIDMFIPHTNITRYDGFTKNNIIFFDIQVTELRSSCSSSSLIL